MEASFKQFDGLLKEAERAKHVYRRRCRDADFAEEQALNKAAAVTQSPTSPTSSSFSTNQSDNTSENNTTNNNDNDTDEGDNTLNNNDPELNNNNETIQLGNQVLSKTDFDNMIEKMHQSIPMQDHRVPIIGLYKNTSTGENISRWLQHNLSQCKDSPAMADVIAQQLIHPYGILRLIGQRGNKFVASPTSFYQWRTISTNNNNGGSGGDDDISIQSSINNGALVFSSLFDRKSNTTSNNNSYINIEEPHKKARSEAERADEAYRTAVKRLDQMRMIIEESLFAHFAEMEQVEVHRISTIKKAFVEYTSCLSTSIPIKKTMVEEMLANQESIKPDQDIQYIIQHYYVAGFSPKAILYENYYHGVAHDQIFGVPLSELGKHESDHVPTFVHRILKAIEEGSQDMDKENKERLWSTPLALDKVHSVRTDINISSDRVSLDLLRQHDSILLVALLRLYLLELPQCLFTFELYDAAYALYSNTSQDTSILLLPISNLIASLPAPHFETLKLIIEHVNRYIKENSISDEILTSISQSLGSAIVRSRDDTLTSSTSRVPASLTYDLIKHYDDVFNENTLQAHAESEKRRQAKPIVVADNTESSTANSSLNKKRGGIMSFMRNNSVDDKKWSLGGVFGTSAHQDTTNNNSNTTLTPTTTTSNTKHSLFASTITHDSPPLSPQPDNHTNVSQPPLPPKNEVMFDVSELVSQKSTNNGITTETILQDIDADDGHHELDPFFDDD
ncbi:unnamed protein product [Cunninghamella echinulata]